eukprot:COSAG01_NODE_13968_length_1513_cov_1.596181_1_plen_144_part_00
MDDLPRVLAEIPCTPGVNRHRWMGCTEGPPTVFGSPLWSSSVKGPPSAARPTARNFSSASLISMYLNTAVSTPPTVAVARKCFHETGPLSLGSPPGRRVPVLGRAEGVGLGAVGVVAASAVALSERLPLARSAARATVTHRGC